MSATGLFSSTARSLARYASRQGLAAVASRAAHHGMPRGARGIFTTTDGVPTPLKTQLEGTDGPARTEPAIKVFNWALYHVLASVGGFQRRPLAFPIKSLSNDYDGNLRNNVSVMFTLAKEFCDRRGLAYYDTMDHYMRYATGVNPITYSDPDIWSDMSDYMDTRMNALDGTGIKLFDFVTVLERLRHSRGIDLSIVSANAYAGDSIRHFGIDRMFDQIVVGKHDKAQTILDIHQQSQSKHVKPISTVHIGDIPVSDLKSAQKAEHARKKSGGRGIILSAQTLPIRRACSQSDSGYQARPSFPRPFGIFLATHPGYRPALQDELKHPDFILGTKEGFEGMVNETLPLYSDLHALVEDALDYLASMNDVEKEATTAKVLDRTAIDTAHRFSEILIRDQFPPPAAK